MMDHMLNGMNYSMMEDYMTEMLMSEPMSRLDSMFDINEDSMAETLNILIGLAGLESDMMCHHRSNVIKNLT